MIHFVGRGEVQPPKNLLKIFKFLEIILMEFKCLVEIIMPHWRHYSENFGLADGKFLNTYLLLNVMPLIYLAKYTFLHGCTINLQKFYSIYRCM